MRVRIYYSEFFHRVDFEISSLSENATQCFLTTIFPHPCWQFTYQSTQIKFYVLLTLMTREQNHAFSVNVAEFTFKNLSGRQFAPLSPGL